MSRMRISLLLAVGMLGLVACGAVAGGGSGQGGGSDEGSEPVAQVDDDEEEEEEEEEEVPAELAWRPGLDGVRRWGKLPPVRMCGGIAGLACPRGQRCIDDPRDDCNPRTGADCAGVCVPFHRGGPRRSLRCFDPERDYVSRDPGKCAAIRFACAPGKEPFFDECGCGCQGTRRPDRQPCGTNVCGPGELCCNASCGICAPVGGVCIQVACEPGQGFPELGPTE